jgi:hypothetical protein
MTENEIAKIIVDRAYAVHKKLGLLTPTEIQKMLEGAG